jgi:hypothetical protein
MNEINHPYLVSVQDLADLAPAPVGWLKATRLLVVMGFVISSVSLEGGLV